MRVVAYLQPRRGGGVARHSREMICGLARAADIELRVWASASALRAAGRPAWLAALHCPAHFLPETFLERCWKSTGWPPADLLIRDADWIYSPAELRLPTRSVRTAITVHDVQAFETDLPWANTPEHRHFRKKWACWLPKMIAEATRVVTVSDFSKRRLVKLLNAPAEKIVVVGNGVDACFFAAGNAGMMCDLLNPRAIIIGGLRTKKGAAATLAVARELERIRSPLQLDIIGQHDGEWVKRAASQTNVHLYGHLSDADMAVRLARSVALLFLSPYEGFGLPALEAMAAGCPSVVANRASLPEVVGTAGLCVEPEQAGPVAETLERLRCDVAWRESFVLAGKAHAAAYTWGRCVERLLTVFGHESSSANGATG